MQHAHIGTTQFQALCDYNPNSDLELKFSRGDIINVVGDVDDDGYFKVEKFDYSVLTYFSLQGMD